MSKYSNPNFPALFSEAFNNLRDFDKKLIQSLGEMSFKLKSILDRGISFDDNMDVRIVTATSHATPGTEFSVSHTLGKIPTGYIVCGQSAVGSLYDGSTANTSTLLYFRSDTSLQTFKIMIF